MATPTLSAVFKVVDEMSSVMDAMADSGSNAVEKWESAGNVADTAFSTATSGANEAAGAMEKAAASQDYWTSAVDSYDKSALEAIYSTQELAEMGMKSQQVLEDEAEMASLCAQARDQLTESTEASVSIQEEMAQAAEEAAQMVDKMADSDRVSAETKEELTTATENFNQAAIELARAEEEAARAAEELARATSTAGTSQEELEQAAERAAHAAESLAEANGNATGATTELSSATQKSSEEFEKNGKIGPEAIKEIESALIAAGLAKLVGEIVGVVMDLTDAFSEAESVIVKATGATGEQLDSLSDSMLKVYATVDDADMQNTAGAIGEINTRLGLQGEELEHVAGLFMMYADNTNSSVVPAVQNVTKVMKNWNVDVEDTGLLLDKLTYAAQASGASVDGLSDLLYNNKALLDQLGYSMDESIALFAMMEYEGINASSVMMGFRTAITGFASEGRDANVAMQETIDQIMNMANESDATGLAIDVFGSRVGAQLSDKIRSGKFDIEEWTSAIENSNGTLEKTDEAADTLADKWTMASNSMKAAFTTTISPAVDAASSGLAGFVQGIGDFLSKSPVLTAILTGIVTALGLAVAGVAAFNAVMVIKAAILPVVTVLTAAFGGTLSAAIWPITLIVAGIAALVAGLILLFNWIGNANSEFNELTATSKQQYETLETLNAEYDEAVELYGENSDAAQKLAQDIAGLEAAYESTKMTLEEFTTQNDALIKSHDSLVESFNSGMNEIDKEEKNATALIGKLEQLASKSDLTAAEQTQMSAIVDKLNEQMPELSLSMDDFADSADKSVVALKELAEAQAKEQRQAMQYKAYTDLLIDRTDLEEQLAKATTERIAAQERQEDVGGLGWFGDSKQAKKDLEAFTAEEERLQAALAETNGLLDEHSQAFEKVAQEAEEAAKATVDYETAVNRAIQAVASDIEELAEAYDDAYESARNSIAGQMGLFESMTGAVKKYAEENKVSTNSMIESLQSQATYLAEYKANLEAAKDLGVSQALISELSDGSVESAAYLEAIVESGEDTIASLNEAFASAEEGKDAFASTVAEMETDFNKGMDDIQARMEEAIVEMTMEADAAASAKATIDAYISQIKSMTGEAHSAATGVANAATNALGGKGISLVGVPGYATGTLDAPNMFIAGEEGPELIVGAGGSTVFPAEETNKILAAANNAPISTSVPAGFETGRRDSDNATVEKKITLEINGNGEIDVSGSYDEGKMTALLFSNLKPILMGLLKQEVYEEGDLAYEF